MLKYMGQSLSHLIAMRMCAVSVYFSASLCHQAGESGWQNMTRLEIGKPSFFLAEPYSTRASQELSSRCHASEISWPFPLAQGHCSWPWCSRVETLEMLNTATSWAAICWICGGLWCSTVFRCISTPLTLQHGGLLQNFPKVIRCHKWRFDITCAIHATNLKPFTTEHSGRSKPMLSNFSCKPLMGILPTHGGKLRRSISHIACSFFLLEPTELECLQVL